jgi:hypothetical protein
MACADDYNSARKEVLAASGQLVESIASLGIAVGMAGFPPALAPLSASVNKNAEARQALEGVWGRLTQLGICFAISNDPNGIKMTQALMGASSSAISQLRQADATIAGAIALCSLALGPLALPAIEAALGQVKATKDLVDGV